AGPDFLHAVADVERVREAVAGEIDLIDVEAAAVDEGAEGLAAAFLLASGNGDRRAVAEPAVPFVVVGIERLFQPADAELLERFGPGQRGAGIPHAAGVDEERAVVADPLASAANEVDI